MKRLPSGSSTNRVVNWMGYLGARVREFSARSHHRPPERRSRGVPRRSRANLVHRQTARKPLRLLAQKKEPHDLSEAGFFVNWSVALFRNRR